MIAVLQRLIIAPFSKHQLYIETMPDCKSLVMNIINRNPTAICFEVVSEQEITYLELWSESLSLFPSIFLFTFTLLLSFFSFSSHFVDEDDGDVYDDNVFVTAFSDR